MTLLISWTGIDSHGIASAYIASDSRISWGTSYTFDSGRKVYGLDAHPDIFGYCGDVLFPTMVLGQVSEMADAGLLFPGGASIDEKSAAISQKLVEQFSLYPADVASISSGTVTIIHISKNVQRYPDFKAFLYRWIKGEGWSTETIAFPSRSGLIGTWGSGEQSFRTLYKKYEAGPTAGTSRSVFQCFCKSVASKTDPYTGGAPQLVGLYRGKEPVSQKFGIISDQQRFVFGASIEDTVSPGVIEWRNELFELCDGRTKSRLDEAQRQPDPFVIP